MSNVSIIPKGYRLKRVGRPEKGERILGALGEVLLCQGPVNAVCAVVEPVGGKGYEARRNEGRRGTDDGLPAAVTAEDEALTPEG